MAETKKSTAMNTQTADLLYPPSRKVVDSETIQRMASRCTDYNDSRSDARNFKCVEIRNAVFSGEDFCGIETHYSKFADCEFENCKLSRMEAMFSSWENCIFRNCEIENADYSFAHLNNVQFLNCNLNGTDFPFAKGNFNAVECMMSHCTAQNANLQLQFSSVNASGFEANFAHIELAEVTLSNFRRSEFNDGVISGKFDKTDLTNSEFNRSELSGLAIIDCATSGMDTDDAVGIDDKALEDAIRELEEDSWDD